jgi:hypothetical protein
MQEAGNMWAAWVVAAIGMAASAFMLGFLIALLREGAPSVCYWIIPVSGRAEKGCADKVVSSIYVDEGYYAPENPRSVCYAKILENKNYAHEECDSSLMDLDVPNISDSLGWRAVRPRGGSVFRERRL